MPPYAALSDPPCAPPPARALKYRKKAVVTSSETSGLPLPPPLAPPPLGIDTKTTDLEVPEEGGGHELRNQRVHVALVDGIH